MPRDSSGTYTLPAGNPVVTGTTIASAWGNNTMTDIKAEVTDSLSRSGKGGMSNPLKLPDGTAALPALTATSETNSGIFRSGSQDWRFVVAATAVFKWLASSIVSLVPHTFTGSATRAPINLTPLAAPSTPSDGDTWIETTSNTLKARINGATAQVYPIGSKSGLPAVGQQISSSCVTFTSSAGALTDVTNLSVSITTTGRAVFVALISDGTANIAGVTNNNAAAASVALDRGGSTIAIWSCCNANTTGALANLPGATFFGSGGFVHLDPVAAGTYTYKVRINPGGSALTIQNYKLAAYEL